MFLTTSDFHQIMIKNVFASLLGNDADEISYREWSTSFLDPEKSLIRNIYDLLVDDSIAFLQKFKLQ